MCASKTSNCKQLKRKNLIRTFLYLKNLYSTIDSLIFKQAYFAADVSLPFVITYSYKSNLIFIEQYFNWHMCWNIRVEKRSNTVPVTCGGPITHLKEVTKNIFYEMIIKHVRVSKYSVFIKKVFLNVYLFNPWPLKNHICALKYGNK